MKLTREQFNVMVYLTDAESFDMAAVAEAAGLDAEAAAAVAADLKVQGFIAEDLKVTDAGYEALEPYRAKKLIFLAAGMGTRLRPITLSVPKPLVRVHGTPIICSAIDAAIAAGIEDIYIVRGYMGEIFDQLLYKYPQLHIIDNPEYSVTNNISSAMAAREFLQDAYIMEADLLINNPKVIRKYNYTSNCLGVPVEKTDDWCVLSKGDGRAIQLVKGGENCHHLFTIYYWNAEEGAKLAGHLEEVYNSEGGKDLFWDITPMNKFTDEYYVEIFECTFDDISEIDTYRELTEVDPAYLIES